MSVESGWQPRSTRQAELGEGARWDDVAQQLLTVDILRGELNVWDIDVAASQPFSAIASHQVGAVLGAVAPVAGQDGRDPERDGWVIARGTGIALLSAAGELTPLLDLAPFGYRVNDAACDAAGRFFVGTLALDLTPGAGSIHRIDPDGAVTRVLDGFTIPNGIGWAPDESEVYIVDSIPGVVRRYPYDAVTGEVGEGVEILRLAGVDSGEGVPDGLTVDAAGDIWVATYAGSSVLRIDRTGVVKERHSLVPEQVTSVAFAGPNLDLLVATTATEFWTDEQRTAYPTAGLLHSTPAPAGVVGRAATPWQPTGKWWNT